MLSNLDINDLALLLVVIYYIIGFGIVGYGFMFAFERLSSWSERWHERQLRRMPSRIVSYRR